MCEHGVLYATGVCASQGVWLPEICDVDSWEYIWLEMIKVSINICYPLVTYNTTLTELGSKEL